MHSVRLMESVKPGERIMECGCGQRDFLPDGAEPVCGRCGARADEEADVLAETQYFERFDALMEAAETAVALKLDEPAAATLTAVEGQEMVLVEGVADPSLTAEQQAEWDAMAERNTAALEAMMNVTLESPAEAPDVEPVSVPEAMVEQDAQAPPAKSPRPRRRGKH